MRGSPRDGHRPAEGRTALLMALREGDEAGELIAAGLLSVLLLPLAGSLLRRGDVKRNGSQADIAP